jgi:hypothetical protein
MILWTLGSLAILTAAACAWMAILEATRWGDSHHDDRRRGVNEWAGRPEMPFPPRPARSLAQWHRRYRRAELVRWWRG